jgi:fibronectin-binding autotransporter adhesin
MRAHLRISAVLFSLGVAAAATPVFAMDGIPHNGGGGASAPTPGLGQIYASVQSALADGSGVLRDALLGRTHQPDGGQGLWVLGHGGSVQQNGDGLATLKGDRGGVIGGFDAGLGHDWRLGVAAGAMRADLKAAGATSAATLQTWQAGLYGGGPIGPLRLSAGLGYEDHRIDVQRTDLTSGTPDPYRADVGATTRQAFAELAYPLSAGALRWEPYGAAAWSDIRTRGFTEHGASAALSGGAADFRSGSTDLGLRVGGSDGAWTPWASLAWRHGFGDRTPQAALTIAQGASAPPALVPVKLGASGTGGASTGDTAFTASGLPIARDSGVVEGGLRLRLSRSADLGLIYDGAFARGLQDQRLALRLSARF